MVFIPPRFSRRASQQRSTKRQPLWRRLRLEPLEDRRLLALVTVNTLGDTVDFDDGVTSLREAIFATNLVGGADTIDFAASLTSGGPATILLTQGELAITDSLTINGPGANLLTIDASGNDPTPDVNNGDGSRVFNIDDGNIAEPARRFDQRPDAHRRRRERRRRSDPLARKPHRHLQHDLGKLGHSQRILAGGGGIFADGNVTVTASTISGNSARRRRRRHFMLDGNVTVTASTITRQLGRRHRRRHSASAAT